MACYGGETAAGKIESSKRIIFWPQLLVKFGDIILLFCCL
jgi:hypothetical protein